MKRNNLFVIGVFLTVFLIMASFQPVANASAVRTGFNTTTLAGNDDGYTGLVSMGFDVDFFGNLHNQLYVNNNGNVTFDSHMATYTPFNLTSTSREIIAPFFGDVDTRTGDDVTYGTGSVDGHNAFGVNWVDVGYYNQQTDKLNSFQLVLIDRSDIGAGDFDIEFNYDKIQWETGSSSGGTSGLGGSSARAGWSNGTGDAGTYYELTGSAVNGAFLDTNNASGLIYNSLNSNVPGRYIFNARNGSIDPGGTTVPEPATMFLFGIGLLGFAGATRKK